MVKLAYMNRIVIIIIFSLVCFECSGQLYKFSSWVKAGSKANNYEMGLDNIVFKTGKKSVYLKSVVKNSDGYGTISQYTDAQNYIGKKIKVTGYIKYENVEGWAGMWLRIDSKIGKKPIRFDNMNNRALQGTSDWKKCEIEMDVPLSASVLNYGALLNGNGSIWFDNFNIEILGPSSIANNYDSIPTEPRNTDFEEDLELNYNAEEVDWKSLKVFVADKVEFNGMNANMTISKCQIIEIESKSGVSGIYVIGDGLIKLKNEEYSSDISGCLLRFNPKDMKQLINIENKQEIKSKKFLKSSMKKLKPSFRHCYHNKYDALIPKQGNYALNFYTKGGEILASYRQEKLVVVFDYSKNKILYNKK